MARLQGCLLHIYGFLVLRAFAGRSQGSQDLGFESSFLASAWQDRAGGQPGLRSNVCKNLAVTDCKVKPVDCRWRRHEATSAFRCEPVSCVGLKGTDCRELAGRCAWSWDAATSTGACAEEHGATPANTGRSNVCKDLKGSLCREKPSDCRWLWDKATATGRCEPLSCAGIKGTDCRELSEQCVWHWDDSTGIGHCLDKRTSSTSAAPKLHPVPEYKSNVCKGLKGSLCREKPSDCRWLWDKATATGRCEPLSCAGIKGTDCRELSEQCVWHWDDSTGIGHCLDKPTTTAAATAPTTTTSAAPKPHPVPEYKSNVCKGLKGSLCREKPSDCRWLWDKATATGRCEPLSCAGIKGSDCRELSEQCVWHWDDSTGIGHCLDKPTTTAATTAPTITTSAAPKPHPVPEYKSNVCKGLKGSLCREKPSDCRWLWDKATATGRCEPLSCAGIKGSDCRELSEQCVWKWDDSKGIGQCLDKPSTTATTTVAATTTTGAGTRTAQAGLPALVLLLLVTGPALRA